MKYPLMPKWKTVRNRILSKSVIIQFINPQIAYSLTLSSPFAIFEK